MSEETAIVRKLSYPPEITIYYRIYLYQLQGAGQDVGPSGTGITQDTDHSSQ